MFLNQYKNKILQNILFKHIKKRKEKAICINQQKIKKVLAVASLPKDIDSTIFQNKMQKEVMESLRVKKDNVVVLIFRKYQKGRVYETFEFHQNSFNWRGKLRDKNLKQCIQDPYDLLISYNFEENLYLKMLTIYAKKTQFFVGFANKGTFLYDLSIITPKGDRTLFNIEMKKYLTILNKL